MTFGQQNTEAEAHEQLSYALEQGVNFLDSAEMYPVPPKKETQGTTDRYIASWLKQQKRDDIFLATKAPPHPTPCPHLPSRCHDGSKDVLPCHQGTFLRIPFPPLWEA